MVVVLHPTRDQKRQHISHHRLAPDIPDNASGTARGIPSEQPPCTCGTPTSVHCSKSNPRIRNYPLLLRRLAGVFYVVVV